MHAINNDSPFVDLDDMNVTRDFYLLVKQSEFLKKSVFGEH
jgi:hypothetical protein